MPFSKDVFERSIYIYMRDCAALGHTRATKPGEEEQSDSGFYTMWTSLEEEKQAYVVFKF